ncbi:MAG: hypothetical protein GX986_11190 [Firmicutes bacterium]|nr:hypothetical protein [Bacillota bacterium]
MRKLSLAVLMVLVVFTCTPLTLAMELGGEVDVIWTGTLQDDGKFDGSLRESLNLELFLPPLGSSEVRYEFLLTQPVQSLLAEHEASYFTKKLYVKHRFEHFHVTLGRQPISWSFGSLLNPVDYTLGAVALDEESPSKYTDALEVYVPTSWNSGVDFVFSFPRGFDTDRDSLKWGARGRWGVNGYDLTINYVEEAASSGGVGDGTLAMGSAGGLLSGLFPRQRLGATVKGDIGNLGVYGALGRYFDSGLARQSNMSYLLGADYSYNPDYFTKITMQLEYLGIDLYSLAPSIRTQLLKMDPNDNRLDLLTGSLSYPLDDFASVHLVTMVNLDDGSLLLSPSYKNTLSGNVDLVLAGSVLRGKADTLFGPSDLMPQAMVSVELSYAF